MDKGLETLYHKLSNLFHTDTPASSSSNATSAHESNTLLPISTFFDRIIPSATNSPRNDQRRSSTRVPHTKRNDNRFATHIMKTTPIDITKQQK